MPPSAEAASHAPAPIMPPIMQRLESAGQVIETKFLDTGKILSRAVEGIAALVTVLDGMGQALSPDAIAAATQELHAASAQLLALPHEQRERGNMIGALEAPRSQLAGRIEDMRRSLSYMRAFSVSIKITVGGISDAGVEFGIFAQEMAQRVETGRAEVDALEHGLFRLKDELQQAMQKGGTLARGCAQTIPAAAAQLHDATALLAAHRAMIGTAAEDAANLAKEVRKQVMRMLVALQIGDITRQRIEHVQAGLDISGQFAPAAQAPMNALLAAQLDAALADFEREVSEIAAGLEALERDARALLSLRERAAGQGTAGSEGLLRSLEQRVAAAISLAGEIEAADALAQATGKQAATAARTLSARLLAIQTMKADVLYMALNTTLKAARLGEAGRPLGIIAAELRTHAGYLDGMATDCVAALQKLVEISALLSSALPEEQHGTAPAQGAAPSVSTALSAALSGITAAAVRTGQDVAALATHGESVLQLLQDSRRGLALHGEIGQSLSEAAAELHRHAATMPPDGVEVHDQLTQFCARLGALYTMAQEREVQAAIAAGWGIATTPPAPPPAASGDLEDALF